MGRYIARYKREHYVRKDIRKDIYEKLVGWCGEASINSCLEKVLNALPRNISGEYGGGIFRGNMGVGNPIDYVESGLTPSKKCVATKVGKSYLIECEDGARAYIPSNAIPDLVERFGLVVREK
jgi:hypothetical protein